MKPIKLINQTESEIPLLLQALAESVTTINILTHILQDEKVNNNKEEKDDIVHSIGEASWHMTQKLEHLCMQKTYVN